MSDLRNFVTFEADFTDDTEWDDDENLVVPGGKNVATTIHGHLVKRGTACTEPEQHGFYGWAFEVGQGSARICIVLQFAGPWLLIADPRRSIADRLLGRRRSDEVSSFLATLRDTLEADNRFRSIQWYTKAEYDRQERGPGNATP